MTKRLPGLLAFLALACALALAGGWLLLTSFKVYDDEGYVLLSLVNYARGGPLYSDVYSQYGPFFYAWTDALHTLLRFDFTNVSARGLTLFYWLAAALCCAWIVDNRTRSTRWASLALAVTFAHLWQMTAEPIHPGGLITFLVAVGAWVGTENISRDKPRLLAIVTGLIGAALALTKINVGVFFFAGTGAWMLLQSRETIAHRWAPWFTGAALALLPWALMQALLNRPEYVTFALVISASSIGIVIAASQSRQAALSAKNLFWLAGAALTVALGVLALSLVRGDTLGALYEGIIRGPLRHPGIYTLAVVWQPGVLWCAAGSLALFLAAVVFRWLEQPWFCRALAVARLALIAFAALGWLELLPLGALRLTTNFGLASLCWLVPPLTRTAAALGHARIRAWLALLTVTQTLHAYPVAGSQLSWGTFLIAPLLVLAAVEAVELLASRQSRWRWLESTTILAAVALAAQLLQTGWLRWRTSKPLQLPGAEVLRLPDFFSAQLRALSLNATVHGGHLFSLPEVCSFNLWSGRPAPTVANATHWFSLLSSRQQEAIAVQLAADPRALVLVERRLLRFMTSTHVPVGGALHDFILREFEPAISTGEYELWVKRGRLIAPLSTAQLYAVKDGAAAEFVLQLCVFASPGARVAKIEWLDGSYEYATPLARRFDTTNCRIDLTPLASSGAPVGPTVPVQFPFALPTFASLTIHSPVASQPQPRTGAILRLRDEHDALVAEAIFVN